jgi:hypothetical protein
MSCRDNRDKVEMYLAFGGYVLRSLIAFETLRFFPALVLKHANPLLPKHCVWL